MSTSDIKRRSLITASVYLFISLLCTVFAFIYEMFSFGVYSLFMIFCFTPALILGCVPFFIVFLTGRNMPGRLAFNLYNAGIATLTIGFIFRGVIEIYGTTNRLSAVYFIVSLAFLMSGAVIWIINCTKKNEIGNNDKN